MRAFTSVLVMCVCVCVGIDKDVTKVALLFACFDGIFEHDFAYYSVSCFVHFAIALFMSLCIIYNVFFSFLSFLFFLLFSFFVLMFVFVKR